MDVYIDANGNASITEVWKTYLSQGTEGFRPYTNLGNSTIYNFSVSDDEYSVTFKITKNYYDALNGSFSISGDKKIEIIESIQAEGFVCKYE